MSVILANVSIEVDNITTGESSFGTNLLNVRIGDKIQVTGKVTPDPMLAAGDLEVEIDFTNGPVGKVGVLSGGFYLWGPAIIPAGSTSFTASALYLPTRNTSDTVKVTVVAAGSVPPPPTGSGNVQVSIHVQNSVTKDSVPNATVYTTGTPGFAAMVTDAGGNVSMQIPPGFYNVNVNNSAYSPGGETINVGGSGGSFTVDLPPLSTTPPPPPPNPNPPPPTKTPWAIIVVVAVVLLGGVLYVYGGKG